MRASPALVSSARQKQRPSTAAPITREWTDLNTTSLRGPGLKAVTEPIILLVGGQGQWIGRGGLAAEVVVAGEGVGAVREVSGPAARSSSSPLSKRMKASAAQATPRLGSGSTVAVS